MCFSRRVRLLLMVIAAGASVSAETRKPIYHIRRYCKATSEYSPIRSIGLTLLQVQLIAYSQRLIPKITYHVLSGMYNSVNSTLL